VDSGESANFDKMATEITRKPPGSQLWFGREIFPFGIHDVDDADLSGGSDPAAITSSTLSLALRISVKAAT